MAIPSKFIHPRPPFEENPVYHQQSPASPLHLSNSLVLRSGASGTVQPATLKNPMGQDMEILEVKFELSGGLGASEASSLIFGGTIWCDLVLGGIRITNGSIPVWNFGRAENLEAEWKYDSSDNITFSSYSWRLPRPLYIPAGMTLAPTFVHTGFIPDDINVRIGYSARTVFVKPKKVYVPWVAKYVSKSFNPITAADADASTDLDLVNPNPEPLNLQRFTGRAMRIYSTGGGTEGIPFTSLVPGPEGFSSQFLSVRITDSYGRPVVRSFTPFRSVFGSLTRSWDMDNGAQLDPESFYKVELVKAAQAVTGASATDAAQVFIAMVGWREMNP